jgi:hypothetical protein
MLTRRSPIADLVAVRRAAEDIESAYLVRTRLRRALLNVARDVARHEGLPQPELPGVYGVPDTASARSRHIAALASDIYQASERMCQPSESLDARWRADWSDLSAKLTALEHALAEPADR